MARDTGLLILDAYRSAAQDDTAAGANYKGLKIHALPAIHEEVEKAAVRAFPPNGDVLDIASGSGALCLRLHDRGFRLTGCDLVTENFRLRDQLPFVEVNLNLPFSEKFGQRYDGITATEIIEHVENPRHFLRECFALLKPGGTLILTTPNVDSGFGRAVLIRSGSFRWFDHGHYQVDGHITPVPLFVLRAALRETGFEPPVVSSVGAREGSIFSGWRIRAFGWLLRRLDPNDTPQMEILFVTARKP